MTMQEPEWLAFLRQILAISQTGLAYCRDHFDRERYEELKHIASRMLQRQAGVTEAVITNLFSGETGYATPKIDVRAAVFDDQGSLLLVREASDNGRWTLPGGWADVNITAAENAAKEVVEESGYSVSIRKLAAVWDYSKQGHTPYIFSCYKMFFLCRLVGGTARTSIETSEIAWFTEANIPTDLSQARVLPNQIKRMFRHHIDPTLATDFD